MPKRPDGMCNRCGKPAVEGMSRCHTCGVFHRIYERVRRNLNRYTPGKPGRAPIYIGEDTICKG
jgi:hypothetical protein